MNKLIFKTSFVMRSKKMNNFIPKYINDWLLIIENMSNDNTYKLAWGRAIIECVLANKCNGIAESNYKVSIPFDDISRCMIKYYWNQIFFFNLKQSPYKFKEPIICKEVKSLIDVYKKINKNSIIPEWYDENRITSLCPVEFNKALKRVSKTLHADVCYRFKNVNGHILEIYEYKKKISEIKIDFENVLLLKQYGVIISKLLNFKWTQLLEKFNFQPKIALKVNAISDQKIRRKNLSIYKNALLSLYKNPNEVIDFYTDKPLKFNDISVDHVLPWSFIYSDDIWNLVLTSKSNNSSKSNSIPSQETIDKLMKRNKEIVNKICEPFKKDLLYCIDNDLITKLYLNCRS